MSCISRGETSTFKVCTNKYNILTAINISSIYVDSRNLKNKIQMKC